MAQKKEFINPKPVGYSDATVVSGGRTIYPEIVIRNKNLAVF